MYVGVSVAKVVCVIIHIAYQCSCKEQIRQERCKILMGAQVLTNVLKMTPSPRKETIAKSQNCYTSMSLEVLTGSQEKKRGRRNIKLPSLANHKGQLPMPPPPLTPSFHSAAH